MTRSAVGRMAGGACIVSGRSTVQSGALCRNLDLIQTIVGRPPRISPLPRGVPTPCREKREGAVPRPTRPLESRRERCVPQGRSAKPYSQGGASLRLPAPAVHRAVKDEAGEWWQDLVCTPPRDGERVRRGEDGAKGDEMG
ncbi:hypothetical protein E2C01_089748 [Portunus trituberculatus]|uniref:Uncharacterized protein n=1 Tax=Portunus trituberculatus TaxID=210409 RepID=A0A5B7JQG3_PORTR|nr:hypothetical protein [Portunus trituberculatus]